MYLEEISHTTGVTLFLCAFAMLLLVLHGRRREPGCSLPPGPRPWPLVGNLFQMGEQIHLSLTNLRVQYGDVFQIKMGFLWWSFWVAILPSRRLWYVKERHLLDVLTSLPSLQLLMAPVWRLVRSMEKLGCFTKRSAETPWRPSPKLSPGTQMLLVFWRNVFVQRPWIWWRLWRNKEMRLEIQGSTQLSC